MRSLCIRKHARFYWPRFLLEGCILTVLKVADAASWHCHQPHQVDRS
jgi:hypothetical protein